MDLRLPPDFKEFLKLLNDHEVRYLLIGGLVNLRSCHAEQSEASLLRKSKTLRWCSG